jgi:hypothetical protein
MGSTWEKGNCLVTEAYGIYNSEKDAISDAMKMYEYYGYEFTHLYVGQVEYFVPQVDADLILDDLAARAYDNGYKYDDYLKNVKSDHIRELDEILTKAYLTWEKKHPEYRNNSYLMTNTVKYSISELKEKTKNKRKGE